MPWVLFGRRWLPTTLLVLAGVALCGRLGMWQLDRLAQRRAANSRITYVTSLPVAELPSTEDLDTQEYRAVRVQGSYDFAGQVALRNQVNAGEYGYHLLTPLVPEGNENGVAKSAVLIDRGWIPAAGNETPENWRKYDAVGSVEVQGVVRLGRAARGSAVGGSASASSNPTATRFVLTVDPIGFSHQFGYSMPSFYVQAGGGEAGGGLPAAQLPSLDLSDGPHLGYAVQWFAFALAMLAAYAVHAHKQEARTR